jgi:hypothetical protein
MVAIVQAVIIIRVCYATIIDTSPSVSHMPLYILNTHELHSELIIELIDQYSRLYRYTIFLSIVGIIFEHDHSWQYKVASIRISV